MFNWHEWYYQQQQLQQQQQQFPQQQFQQQQQPIDNIGKPFSITDVKQVINYEISQEDVDLSN